MAAPRSDACGSASGSRPIQSPRGVNTTPHQRVIRLIVVLVEKRRLAPVPSLRDMMRHPGHHLPRKPWHFWVLSVCVLLQQIKYGVHGICNLGNLYKTLRFWVSAQSANYRLCTLRIRSSSLRKHKRNSSSPLTPSHTLVFVNSSLFT